MARKVATRALVESGLVEEREPNQLRIDTDGWQIILEHTGSARATSTVEKRNGLTLVHFDLPAGSLGEYHISVLQPFVDIHRSWVGAVDCWRGSELTSIALNYEWTSASNLNLPVMCNYHRSGSNRGVIALLNQERRTRANQRALIETPPMQFLQTRFSRERRRGGFRETVVINRRKEHFAAAVKRVMRFCRQASEIAVMPCPDWAREPVWCSWYSHLYTLTQADVEAQIPHLKKLGIRTVIVDASWFKQPHEAYHRVAGDYLAQKNLFPDMRGLARKMHEHGLKLMLWCVPQFVGDDSQACRELNPFRVWNGKERTYTLCSFCPESRKHASDLVERVMRDYELDGLKIDFLDAVEAPCVDPQHRHADSDSGPPMRELMRSIRDGILRANPDAAIEYRVSYSTLVSQPFANCHRGNDAPYDADYIRRENLFLRLFCEFPSAVWSDYAYVSPDESAENFEAMLAQQIFSGGVPTLSVDLTRCRPSHRRAIGKWLAFYHEHRASLARAELVVHSADSALSATSLQDETGHSAFVLLAGGCIPNQVELHANIKQVWVFNASAVTSGTMTVKYGSRAKPLKIRGQGLFHTAW